MASLTRGISFRRQGSSGMSWTDTWSFNEEGVLVRSTKEEAAASQHQLHGQRFGGASLSRIHDLHLLDEDEVVPAAQASTSSSGQVPTSSASGTSLPVADCPPSPGRLLRSKSTSSVPARPNALAPPPRKPGLRVIRWLKKTFSKTRKWV